MCQATSTSKRPPRQRPGRGTTGRSGGEQGPAPLPSGTWERAATEAVAATVSVPAAARVPVGKAEVSARLASWPAGFFDENNAELVVKVLDGRAVNGHYWVFYGALSDVAYTLEVRDTLTGTVKTYTNPAGRLTSRADTTAFAVPGTANAATAPVLSAPTELGFLASSGASPGTSFPSGPFCVEYTPPSTGFCLGGRFDVAVEWRANGTTGLARGAVLGGDSGYFWFFGQNNVELVVKVLDGRAVNGRFWFFSGALTDVEHWIHVRDSVTGEEKVYHSPPGRLASRADTSAF